MGEPLYASKWIRLDFYDGPNSCHPVPANPSRDLKQVYGVFLSDYPDEESRKSESVMYFQLKWNPERPPQQEKKRYKLAFAHRSQNLDDGGGKRQLREFTIHVDYIYEVQEQSALTE